jgi:acetylornithine deacetylase/succinyl-diaminopimelate desuccinylase-like protein
MEGRASPTLLDVFSAVDTRASAFLDELMDLVRQPSISSQGIGVAECAQLLLGTMSRSGLSARLLPTHGYPVVFGERHVGNDRPTLLVYGHYDVQPVDPLDAWDSPPFEPVIRDGRIWGRGSSDNKGQHLAQLLAMRTYLYVAGELPINVKVILEGEEESSSPHLAAFVEANAETLRADLVYTSDGPIHESGRATVVLGVRGILYVELRARGANTDVHSGNRGGVVPNPAWTLVDVLHSLRRPDGTVAIDGFYDGVRPIGPLERAALDALPVDVDEFLRGYGLSRLPPPDDWGFFERLMLQPTLNVSGFSSGYGGPGMKTIIPSTATAKLDMRLVADQDPEHVFRCLVEHVRARAPDVEVVRIGAMEPSRTPLDHAYVKLIAEAVAQAHDGQPPLIVPALGGSLPDYVFTRILGLPSILVPYANADQRNHAPNENFAVERFTRGIKTFAAVMEALAR